MGVAQNCKTVFWTQAANDPGSILTWITQVVNAPNAPLVNSLSYGGDERTDAVSLYIWTRLSAGK